MEFLILVPKEVIQILKIIPELKRIWKYNKQLMEEQKVKEIVMQKQNEALPPNKIRIQKLIAFLKPRMNGKISTNSNSISNSLARVNG